MHIDLTAVVVGKTDASLHISTPPVGRNWKQYNFRTTRKHRVVFSDTWEPLRDKFEALSVL